MDQARPAVKRADAERNRDKILVVARAAFAEPGDPVSMAEVARRAGVGMATLYRDFPGRRELLEALYADEVRGDLSLEQVLDLVAAISSISGGPEYSQPILRAALDGLRVTRP